MSKRKIVVVDIDGTIADVSHRLHHIHGKKKDWKRFFEGMDRDTPITSVVDHVRKLAREHEIVMLTGRPNSYRERTEAWLKAFDIPHSKLLMRPAGDHRPDYVTKAELMRSLDLDSIALALDDRPPVCVEYRKLGVRCVLIDSSAENQWVNELYREMPA